MTRPTLIDLNQDKHDQGLCYYPVMTIWINIMRIIILLVIHQVEYVPV